MKSVYIANMPLLLVVVVVVVVVCRFVELKVP